MRLVAYMHVERESRSWQLGSVSILPRNLALFLYLGAGNVGVLVHGASFDIILEILANQNLGTNLS